MRNNQPILFCVFALLCFNAWGQGTIFTKATRNEQMNHFVDASKSFQGLYLRGDREASLQAARNLYKARRYEEALPLYEFADSLKIITDAEQVFAFFECLKSLKRYEEADLLVKARLGEYADRPEFGLHHEKIDFYNSILAYKGADLKLLELNSEFSEISPTPHNGWLYFSSTRPATGNHTVHRINMQPFYNFYATPLEKTGPEVTDPKGTFGKAPQKISLGSFETLSIPEGINKKFHDGPINITPTGKFMFFTSNQFVGKKAKDVVNLIILYSENKDGVWQIPQSLPFNSTDFSNQHGYFDEATSTLYFASNRPGGQGGWDIWKSKLDSSGSWSEVVNLGAGVNSVKTEVFPSMSPDGKLIFASNGWPGLGGLDMFLVQTGRNPLNLLAGINSEKDDFGILFTDKDGGFLVSNRSGGAGDDDIYAFTMKYEVSEIKRYNRQEVLVEFMLKDNKSGEKIAEAQAMLVRDGLEIPLTVKDGESTSLRSGDSLVLQADGYRQLTLSVSEIILDAGKITAGFDKELTTLASSSTDNLDSGLNADSANSGISRSGNGGVASGDRIKLASDDNHKYIIYFNFDKEEIRKDAEVILTRVAYVLLEEYKMAEILLTGHTDSRGSDGYNLQLSRKRVEAAKKWLVSRGVDPKRIRTEHYGEIRPARACEKLLSREFSNQSCLSEADHQLNRRVEFRILNENQN